jgi:hypothetical protein
VTKEDLFRNSLILSSLFKFTVGVQSSSSSLAEDNFAEGRSSQRKLSAISDLLSVVEVL